MTEHESSAASPSFPQEIVWEGMVLKLIAGQVYLEFVDTLSPEEVKAFHEEYRLQPVERRSTSFPHSNVGEQPLRADWLQLTAGEESARFIAETGADERIRSASPVYHRADRLPADSATSFTDQVLVHFGPYASEKEIAALIAALDTEIVATEAFQQEGTLYQLRLRFPKRQDIFAIVDKLARSELVRYAGPDWIQLQSPVSTTTPDDPKFGQQWNLYTIAAPQGWDYTQGDGRVIIAIIDSGCDLDHPDLVGKYVPEADRLDILTNTQTPEDALFHGTFCAGIAAAQTDNKIGIAGVAPNCSIMPIRLFGGRGDAGIRSQLDIVRAIGWARTHGAKVLSMSWYYNLPHGLVDIAFEEAYQANVVMVAAAGNCFKKDNCLDPARIDYPASHSRIMAVGASDKNDRRQTQTNGFDPSWDSKYGPELSVMAPGVYCPTTNIGGGYVDSFYGTSAAAPHVAGLAALLLSLLQHAVNIPPFTQMNDLVRSIIEGTAAKVGAYSYVTDAAHPNGSWNKEMGYGRIDLARALRYARDRYTPYKLERVSRDYAHAVLILFGLVSGGPGVVFPPGGPPVPVDPGWLHLSSEQRDVLLGLAITELAKGVNDPEASSMLGRAGWDAIMRTAQRMEKDS